MVSKVRSMKGMSKIKDYCEEELIKVAGVKFGKSKCNKFFKRQDVKKLQKERAKLTHSHSSRG